MTKNLIFSLLFLPLVSFAQTQTKQFYRGKSPISYNNKNDCKLTLTLNAQKQIIAVDTEGASKRWEIMSENGTGYGPETSIVYNRTDEMLSDPKTFANLRFEKSNNFFSDGFVLKSSVSAGTIRATYKLEFNMKLGRLESFKKTTKYKVTIISMATDELECSQLVKTAN